MSASGLLDVLNALQLGKRLTEEEEQVYYRLKDLVVNRVDLVRQGANGRRFALVKSDKRGESMTTQQGDEGFGPEVVVDEDGKFVVAEGVQKATVPGPAKDGMLKKLTEASERLASLINKLKGAESGPPGGMLPPEFSKEAKAIGELLGGVASSYPSPKTASPGEEKKEKEPMTKQNDDPNVFTLGDDEIAVMEALVPVAKRGRAMSGAKLDRFKKHLLGLQDLLKELDSNPSTEIAAAFAEALKPVAKSLNTTAEALKEILTSGKTPEPAAEGGDPKPEDGKPEGIAKSTEPAKPEPVPGGQAKPAAPKSEPVAKGETTWDEVVNIDLNDESNSDSGAQ